MTTPSTPDHDLPAEPRRRGRPRIHPDAAARSRAYRARQADKRARGEAPVSRADRLAEDLLQARTETSMLRARVAELEQLAATQADDLRRLRQHHSGGAGR